MGDLIRNGHNTHKHAVSISCEIIVCKGHWCLCGSFTKRKKNFGDIFWDYFKIDYAKWLLKVLVLLYTKSCQGSFLP